MLPRVDVGRVLVSTYVLTMSPPIRVGRLGEHYEYVMDATIIGSARVLTSFESRRSCWHWMWVPEYAGSRTKTKYHGRLYFLYTWDRTNVRQFVVLCCACRDQYGKDATPVNVPCRAQEIPWEDTQTVYVVDRALL